LASWIIEKWRRERLLMIRESSKREREKNDFDKI
jgi:hypothetical protein